MKQKQVYQSPRMQSIELSSLASLLAASDGGGSTPSGPTNNGFGASLNAMTMTSFQ
ncbi:MAG: hypothetical protein J6O23_08410 [Prevotella sp.]|nr:hypothetical protein [Prevotella sp.]